VIKINDVECGNNCSIDELNGIRTVEINVNGLASEYTNVQQVTAYGYDGDDSLDAEKSAVPVTLYGGPGNDSLTGGSADDLMYGEDDDDYIDHKEGGADEIYGGNGNDIRRTNLLSQVGELSRYVGFEIINFLDLDNSMSSIKSFNFVSGRTTIISNNGLYEMILETFGLVLYQNGNEVWRAQTNGHGNPATPNRELTFNANGNLLLINEDGTTIWSVETGSTKDVLCQLSLSDSGELAIHDTSGTLIWSLTP